MHIEGLACLGSAWGSLCCQVGREAGMGLPSLPKGLCSGGSVVWGKRSRVDSCSGAASRSWPQPCGQGHTQGLVCTGVLSFRHKERHCRPWEGREHSAG